MKYIEIQDRIISLENIEQIVKDIKEREIIIFYKDITTIKIDYENVKDNINEEKTELEKDYEKIKKELIPEKENENKIKELEGQIEIYKLTLSNISSDMAKYKRNLKDIINGKEFSHKKIQKLKEVI